MIEDKESYYNRVAELANKKDKTFDELSLVAKVEALISTYGTSSLDELKDRLNTKYNVESAEYNEFTRERDETFEKICTEFGACQVQNWISYGYDTIDLVNLYLSGKLKKE